MEINIDASSMLNKIKISFSREILIFIALIIISLALIPISIFIVGNIIIDDYCSDPLLINYCENGGITHLYQRVWEDFLSFNVSAWALITAPYLIILLTRTIVYINKKFN